MAIFNPTYQNPYLPYTPAVQNYQVPQTPDGGIIWVQGESGAKAYPIQNGKSVILFDSESEHFFIKSADVSGMPQPLRIFSYKEATEIEIKPKIDTSNFITRQEFEEAINSLKNRPQTYQRKEGNKNGKPLIQRTNE